MQIDSATPPMGFAQNDSIDGGIEISYRNEWMIHSCICGANSTQLGLPFFAPHEVLVKGVFLDISHHIVARVNGFAYISIIYPQKF